MAHKGSRFHAKLNQRRWRQVRRGVLNRDGWRCQSCGGARGLEVDHIQPLHKGGAPWDVTNLQTLCRDCHRAKSANEHPYRDPARRDLVDLAQELVTKGLSN